jgi:hypothetical protein
VTADGLGNFHFYVPTASLPVTIQYYGSTLTTYFVPDQTFGGGGNGGGGGGPLQVLYSNSADGTACHQLAQIDQTVGSTTLGFLETASGAQSLVAGVVLSGCGTTGSADLVLFGFVQVMFDTASAAVGDAVGISTTPGLAHDLGSASPTSGSIIGMVTLSSNGQPASACSLSPGCWILFTGTGGGGGGGGSANAVVNNPAVNATNTIVPTVSTVTALTSQCPLSAVGTLGCLTVTNSSGTQVLAALQNGQVQLGSSSNAANYGSGTTSNTDWGGILTASSSTATYSFVGSYSVHPLCFGIDLTSGHLGYLVPTYTGTSSVSFTTGGTTDTVQYHCPYLK